MPGGPIPRRGWFASAWGLPASEGASIDRRAERCASPRYLFTVTAAAAGLAPAAASRHVRPTRSECQPFSLQALAGLAAHALDAFAHLGRVVTWTMCFAFIRNGFRLGPPNALDAASRIGIGVVDIDGGERRADGYSQREGREKFLDHVSLP